MREKYDFRADILTHNYDGEDTGTLIAEQIYNDADIRLSNAESNMKKCEIVNEVFTAWYSIYQDYARAKKAKMSKRDITTFKSIEEKLHEWLIAGSGYLSPDILMHQYPDIDIEIIQAMRAFVRSEQVSDCHKCKDVPVAEIVKEDSEGSNHSNDKRTDEVFEYKSDFTEVLYKCTLIQFTVKSSWIIRALFQKHEENSGLWHHQVEILRLAEKLSERSCTYSERLSDYLSIHHLARSTGFIKRAKNIKDASFKLDLKGCVISQRD